MTMYKKELTNQFNISEEQVKHLTEEDAETLINYLLIYDYVEVDNSRIFWLDGSLYLLLKSPDNRYAELYFNSNANEVLLTEYEDEKRKTVLSVTSFTKKTRADYIRRGSEIDLLYTTEFRKTIFIDHKDYALFWQSIVSGSPIPEGIIGFTIYAPNNTELYIAIMNIKNTASNLRKKLATKNPEL